MNALKLLSAVLLLVAVSAQENGYRYEKPRGQYLPPSQETTRPPPTRPPPQSTSDNLSDSLTTARPPPQSGPDSSSDNSGDGDHEPGMPYDFGYEVNDGDNQQSHRAESDGEVVRGEYRVLLPDGRMQIVKYTADWKNGYQAEVTYEGEAHYPEPAPQQPQPTQGPVRPPGSEAEENIDSGFQTTSRPATQPPQAPNGLYGAPQVPFGVRMNPKFGYNKRSIPLF